MDPSSAIDRYTAAERAVSIAEKKLRDAEQYCKHFNEEIDALTSQVNQTAVLIINRLVEAEREAKMALEDAEKSVKPLKHLNNRETIEKLRQKLAEAESAFQKPEVKTVLNFPDAKKLCDLRKAQISFENEREKRQMAFLKANQELLAVLSENK